MYEDLSLAKGLVPSAYKNACHGYIALNHSDWASTLPCPCNKDSITLPKLIRLTDFYKFVICIQDIFSRPVV